MEPDCGDGRAAELASAPRVPCVRRIGNETSSLGVVSTWVGEQRCLRTNVGRIANEPEPESQSAARSAAAGQSTARPAAGRRPAEAWPAAAGRRAEARPATAAGSPRPGRPAQPARPRPPLRPPLRRINGSPARLAGLFVFPVGVPFGLARALAYAWRAMATSPLPLFHLYGDPPDDSAFDFIHIETIASRSSVHDWTIRAHRHRNLFQLLLIEQGGGEMSFETAPVSFTGPGG